MALALLLTLSACDAWLDVKPYDKISQDELLSTEDGYMKLLNGIYVELNSDMLYGGALSVEMIEIMGGAYTIGTDNTVWGNYADLAEYEYGTDYWRARFNEIWNKAYSLILNCNLLLDNLQTTTVRFTGDNYKIIKGEALALRAMLHFDMLRIFGPVYSRNPDMPAIPYYKRYSVVPNEILPASEVADEILHDLQEARILLANLETAPSADQVMPVPVRPSKVMEVNCAFIASLMSAVFMEGFTPALLQAWYRA